MDAPKPNDSELVQKLCEIKDGLNGWEVGFIEDLAQRVLAHHQDLTPRMREKAEAILRRQTHEEI